VIYICAGLYAEGRSDYEFLLPLLNRLLDGLAASLFDGAYELGPAAAIDARSPAGLHRAERIAIAIGEWWGTCTLFVIHADGAADPDGARRDLILPGLEAARAAAPRRHVTSAACVPVREMEAWMLADPSVLEELVGESATPAYPTDPEDDINPKASLRRILNESGLRRAPERLFAFFGERVRFDALRRLSAFRAFEEELIEALGELGRT
jgi:hypothetical protein